MTTRIELSYDETKKLVKNLMEYPLKKWKYSKKEKSWEIFGFHTQELLIHTL
jgi:hypothetical protein